MADEPVPLRLVPTGGTAPTPPVFERVAVVGLGLMGASLAMAARHAWPSALVIGVDANDVLETAVRMHAIDLGADDLVVAAEADLVVLAAPLAENARLLGELAGVLTGEAVITDTGSAKRLMLEAAIGLPPRLTFIGGHPLAGAPRRGIEHARGDLYQGRPWILTPPSSMPPAVSRLEAFIRGVGAMPRTMTADQHDHVLAYLSHLPQLVVSALTQVIGEEVGETGLSLAGRGLLDTARLAASPGSTWKDVYAANADEVRAALDALTDTLTLLRGRLEQGEVIEGLFDSANFWRKTLVD